MGLSSPRKNLPVGTTTTDDGFTITRVQSFALDTLLGPLAPCVRRLAGFGSAQSTRPPRSTDSRATTPSSEQSTPAAARSARTPKRRSLRQRFTALGSELARQAWGPVSLTDYWIRSISHGAATRPDTVHVNDANTLVPGVIIARLVGAGLVYDSHELWLHRNVRQDRRIAPLVEKMIERWGIANADAVVTVSASIATWLQREYKLARTPYLVRNVPRGQSSPDPRKGRLRELAGLSDDTQVIAYGGGITTARGIEETISALPHLHDAVHFVMLGYGEPEYIAGLRAQARSLGVADRVHVVGPVGPDEVADALSDGDVSVVHIRPVVLSYRFALPNKLFESIRAGLPIVASDLPDIRALVTELGVGVLVPGEDPAALGSAIRSVLEDSTEFRKNAVAAAGTLTWDGEAQHLIEAHQLAFRARKMTQP